jgi:hypothetical protein
VFFELVVAFVDPQAFEKFSIGLEQSIDGFQKKRLAETSWS